MKVLFIDTVHPCLAEELETMGHTCEWKTELSPEEVTAIIGDYDGLVMRSKMKLDQPFLEKATQLKFIARSGSGMENIDVTFAESKGIHCFNSPEGSRDAVGEHTLALLLALFNKLVAGDLNVREGGWDREGHRGVELTGKTVGIIGFGNMGSSFAEKLSGFNCTVLAYDKYKENFGTDAVSEVTLEELQQQADVISFHVPLTEETTYYLNADFIGQCAKPFYLLNTSRGKVVDTAALVDGLESEQVLGAGLDVLEFETLSFERLQQEELPAPFKYLTASSKTVLSPHVAGYTVEAYRKLSQVLADKIKAAGLIA